MSEKIDKAMNLFKEGKYKECIDAFSSVLETEPDNADIYNNMGVVAFYMESFLPSKNYLNLAYEITRSILGLGHPRTLYIKSNLAKLSQLSFNKEVVFKTLSKIPALTQLIQNPKRAKKKKK